MADQYIFCEGSMQKKEAKGKWVTYYCVLRGDRLWCFSNRDTNNPSSLVGSIKMTTNTQLKKHKTKDGNYQFKIRNDRGEYRFRCSFTSDRDRWLMEIGKCARGEIPISVTSQMNQQISQPVQQPMQQQQQPVQQQRPMDMGQPAPMGGMSMGGVGGGGSQGRPQMEVPGLMNTQSMHGMGGGSVMNISPLSASPNSGSPMGMGGSQENLLPGQRIALEERRRQTGFQQPPMSSMQPARAQLVRGQGSSASMRSVAPRQPQSVRPAGMTKEDEYYDQEWFYGRIPREVAEDYVLSYGVDGSFLLRESESSPGCYSLSFKSEHNDVRHYKIVRQGQRYTLTGLEEKSFPNIIEVVQYYVEVNEGWAVPLRRSETGYRKHPNLRDDAQPDPSFTAGFDLPGTSAGSGSLMGGHLGGPIPPPMNTSWDNQPQIPMQDNFHAPPQVPQMPSGGQSWQQNSRFVPPPPPMEPPPMDEIDYCEPPIGSPGDMMYPPPPLNDFPPPMSPHSGQYPPPPPPMDPPPF
ncbi:uncharacterized protein LOC135819877 [Sycon ciliatum]|uniref:uncharacterized protein LOC135819877 n=1 Tax=Sycon ciliatum TaxID=27933 RepID=UPI0031F6F1A1